MKSISYIIHFFKMWKSIFSRRNKKQIKKIDNITFEYELEQKKDSRCQAKCYLIEDNGFIKSRKPNLIDDFLLKPASLRSKLKFKTFTTENLYFSTFDQLNNIILNSTANKINLGKYLTYVTRKDKFEANLMFFYNVLVKLVGLKMAPYLLYELNIESDDKMEKGILAVAKGEVRNANFYSFDITFSKKAFNMTEEEIYKSYLSGFYSTYNVFHPFIHEMGHIIDYYARTPLKNRENLLTLFNTQNNSTSFGEQTQNMIMYNNYHSMQSTTNENLSETHYNEPVGAKELKKFVYFKFRNRNFNFLYDEETLYLLTSLVVGSNYAKVNDKELFAEAFAKWLLTKEQDYTYAWEILNEFFIDYFIEWIEPKGKLLK